MENKLSIFLVLAMLMASVLGCSRMNPLTRSNEPTPTPTSRRSGSTTPLPNGTDEARNTDADTSGEKIGVQECDEVMDFFEAEANNPDDNFVTKAVKATVLNKMKEQFRKALEDNKSNKADLAKTCRDFKKNLDKYKSEEDAKSKK